MREFLEKHYLEENVKNEYKVIKLTARALLEVNIITGITLLWIISLINFHLDVVLLLQCVISVTIIIISVTIIPINLTIDAFCRFEFCTNIFNMNTK